MKVRRMLAVFFSRLFEGTLFEKRVTRAKASRYSKEKAECQSKNPPRYIHMDGDGEGHFFGY